MTNSYTIGADGVSIAVYDFGGDGPDLLLAHATGFHAHVLEPMIGHLLASFHCYAFDARGHGASGVPDNGDFDWHRSAGDVLAVLDHLGLERPYGFGHSAGGALVLLAEEQVPGTWRALYTYEPVIFHPGLLAPPSEAPTAATNPLAAGALRRRTDFPSRADAFANFAAKPPFSVLAPDALRAYVEYGFVDRPDGSVTLACRPESEAATYNNAQRHDAWSRLDQVTCPVTVAGGGLNPHFSPEVNQEVADRLVDGRVATFAGLGHFGPLEDPARVAGAVIDALR